MKEIENVLIESSARHVHLSKKDAENLFGKDYKLNSIKVLSQKDFLSDKRVNILFQDKKIENVAVLGPEREKTQVEISVSDAFQLKLPQIPPVRESGNLKESHNIELEHKNRILITEGLIIAKRHLHISEEDAKKHNLKNGQQVKAKILGEREAIFHNILVRVKPHFSLALHLDTDEANAVGINKKADCVIFIEDGELINKENQKT